MPTWSPAALAGLGLGLSLIIAIGAQNAFVLRQGLRREHVLRRGRDLRALGPRAHRARRRRARAACSRPSRGWSRWCAGSGAAFLLLYGLLAARRALRPSRLEPPTRRARRRRVTLAVAATCLALTWLNPHVYLDTVRAARLGREHPRRARAGRSAPGRGSAASSGSRRSASARACSAPLFARPIAWRVLDAIIAVVMIALAAISLAVSALS